MEPSKAAPAKDGASSASSSGTSARSSKESGSTRGRFWSVAGWSGRTQSPAMLEPVLKSLRVTHPKASTDIVLRAFEVARDCHEGQVRRSGEPYITHPVAVAGILADIGLPPDALAAALLHDTVEDTDYSLEELRAEFGDKIALLVDGVTKLDKVKYGEAAQAETVRKMVVAMAQDIQVLVIKLADRLHNARTWAHVSPSSAAKKARETLEIYAPLAHRLGMNNIKWELEDRSFQVLYPDVYDQIVELIAERAPARQDYLAEVKALIEEHLKAAKLKVSVAGRPKHYYSIYQKMMVRGRELDDIYDLVGVRVLTDSVRDCYGVLGAIHDHWQPIPGRIKDYIASPKFNMYQSLHTTVVGPQGKPVEIQIRTHAMHRRAEIGVAAHWKYKDKQSTQDLSWLRQVIDWQSETSDPGEFLDGFRYQINATEVFVFTPAGDVLSLPAGSTPIDFAYAVHTEVGHKMVGAKVNDKLVGLDYELSNGDRVEVLLSNAEGAGPNHDWLKIAKSPRARNKIKQWFTKERRESAIEKGRDELARACRKHGVSVQRTVSQPALLGVTADLRLDDVESLFLAIGEHRVSATSVVRQLVSDAGGERGTEEDRSEAATPLQPPARRKSRDPSVVVKGSEGVWTKLARCCMPVPGDEITGFVTRGHGVSVHRKDCTNAKNLVSQQDRVVEVEWADQSKGSFLVQIQVNALDRAGLLADVTRVLADQHVDLHNAEMKSNRQRQAELKFTFEMGDRHHLQHLLDAVAQVRNVHNVQRVTGAN